MSKAEETARLAMRLAGHQLTGAGFERPHDLVAWMGAMQAQDYAMVKWAVGLRLKGGNLNAVNEALERGEIVRTHVMRPTWHLVAGEDIRWMLKLSGPRVKKCIDSWTKGKGLDIPESLYTRSNDRIGKALSGHRCMTKEELGTELERAGIPVDPDRIRRYLLRAELLGIVCSGGDRQGKPTYALLDEHVTAVPELCREEALAKLALNYFRSHAPATLKDFVWWSGLTITEAKQSIKSLGPELRKECVGEQEFLMHVSCGETRMTDCVHCLPPYDEYLLSYKDRSLVLHPQHVPKAYNKWGIFYPVVLYNGRIVGNWSRTEKKKEVAAMISLFDTEHSVKSGVLEKAISKYKEFLTLPFLSE